jgi:hypothetical protein
MPRFCMSCMGMCMTHALSFPLRRTLAMVKPDAIKHLGKILNAIYQSGFRVK